MECPETMDGLESYQSEASFGTMRSLFTHVIKAIAYSICEQIFDNGYCLTSLIVATEDDWIRATVCVLSIFHSHEIEFGIEMHLLRI